MSLSDNMKKYIRKHLKDEKRILKLMYYKGIFKIMKINLESIAWEELLRGNKQRKGIGRQKYGGHDYLPELHVYTSDYYGECDSLSLINCYHEYLYYKDCYPDADGIGLISNSQMKTRSQLIQHLSKLPTVNKNSKINYILKRNHNV